MTAVTAQREALETAARALTRTLLTDPQAVRGHLWCRLNRRSSSSSLDFTDSSGESLQPSTSLSRRIVKYLQDSRLFDGHTLELSFDRSGGWEAVTTLGDPREVLVRPLSLSVPHHDLPAMMPEELAELQQVWATGAGDYETSVPATEAQLDDLATALGRPVPPQIASLLQLSDGATVSCADEDLDWNRTMTSGWELLSAEAIAQAHQNWSELATDGPYDGVALDLGRPGATAPRLLHPGWIPFASDGGGNHLAVDTVPGPAGVAGQVLEFGRDLHDGAVVHADSVLDFLAGRRHESVPSDGLNTLIQAEDRRVLRTDEVPPACQNLRLVGLSEVSGTTVARAAGLKSLLVRDVESVDLDGLQNLPLQELRLLDLEGVDLAPLAGHPALRRLTLENIRGLRGVAALGTLPALESVSFTGPVDTGLVRAVADNPRLHQVSFDRDLPLEDAITFADILRPEAPVQVHRESGRA